MEIKLQNKGTQWLALFSLALVWGSSFILMKRGLESFSSDQVAAYRIFLSFIILLPIAWKQAGHLKGKYLWPLVVVGFVGNCFPAFLFTKAQTVVDSSFAGMLNSMVPLWALIIGALFFSMKPLWYQTVGVMLGLIGVLGLLLVGEETIIQANLSYGNLIVAATIFYAITLNVIKRYLHHLRPKAIASLAFLLCGPPTGIYLFSTDFVGRIGQTPTSWMSLLYITILGVFGTGLAVILFNALIKHTTALFAATVTYMVPVVAIFWGMVDGEQLSIYQFLWISVILLGVYLVSRNSSAAPVG